MTGTKAGTVTVTATADGKSGSITVTVKDVVGDYTYTVEAVRGSLGVENFSKVKVFLGNKDVTAEVVRAFHDGTNLGSYNADYGAIIVNNNDVDKVNRVYHNGEWHTVTRK